MQNTVVCIGELLWDVFTDGSKKIGGSSTNASLHFAKQGLKTCLISAVGDDDDGIQLINNLTVKNLSTRLVQVKENLPTSRVNVKLDEEQNASYKIAENVAWDDIALTEGAIESVKNADAFVFCSLTCRRKTTRKTVSELAENARLAIFDLNLRAPFYEIETIKLLLEKADVLKINETELSYLRENFKINADNDEGSLTEISKRFGLKMICLTLGINGAMALFDNQFYKQQGYKVKVADTVGAGDAFLASFVAGFLAGEKIPKILEHACLVGAFVTSKPGANPFYDEEILNEFRQSIS